MTPSSASTHGDVPAGTSGRADGGVSDEIDGRSGGQASGGAGGRDDARADGYVEHVTRVLREDRTRPRLGNVAVLRFAPPEGEERRPATLGPQSITAVTSAIAEALDQAEAGRIAAIALTGTGRTFLAGADLAVFADPTATSRVAEMTAAAHALQVRARAAGVPILAHLNGVALGGGLEIALLASIRTAAPGVRGIGLPETSLGIIPGWGGTTLLPTVIDPDAAVRMILEDPARDRPLTAEQAHEVGLVHALADDLDAALDVLAEQASAPADAGSGELPAAGTAWAGELRAALDAPHSPAETRRQWAQRLADQGAPAVATTLDLLDQLPGSTLTDALARESDVLTRLVASPAATASLYAADLLRHGKPGRAPIDGAQEIARVGVAGAGLMAAQIAAQFAIALQVPVVLRDLEPELAQRGLAAAHGVIDRAAERGKLTPEQADQVKTLLTATTEVRDLAGCDLVIEAVPEVRGIKRAVFAELEQVLEPSALLVSNTSSLSIAAMAVGLAHPERVLGLHFFNPVEKMPLIEVIRADATSDDALATGRDVARGLGKFAVTSADAPGFIVNRLLFRMLGAVLAAIDAGADPSAADASLDPIGLPMRPLALLDLVGPGVADHVGEVLHEQLGDRFQPSPLLHAIAAEGERFTEPARDAVHAPVRAAIAETRDWLTDTGRGGDGSATVGPAGATSVHTGQALEDTVLDALADEIARMLDDQVVDRVEQIDFALILGAGFPRHRGGITPYLDASGAAVRATGRRFHGDRFAAGQHAGS